MASYVSNQPIRYNQTTSNINLPLEANVLSTLEGRYNQNKAQIQQVLDAYGSIDLLRDSDKEYLAGKLKDVTENINNSGNRNLAMSYVAQDGLNKARTVAQDPVFLDAMESTINKKNYDTQYSEMCKKDPSKCNSDNYDYGLYKAGFYDYMSGNSNKLGSVKVRPYTDYMTNAIKKAEDLKKLKGEQEIETVLADGRKQIKKINGLTVDEVINYFPEILSSEEKEQMRIDGWAKMKNLNRFEVEKEANTFFNSKIKLLDNAVKEQDSIIKGDGYTQPQKDDALRLKQVYEAQKKDYELLNTQIDKQSPEDIGYLFQKEQFNKTASTLFTGRTSITYDFDDYYKQQQLELDIRPDRRAEEELTLKMNKEKGLNADGTSQASSFVASPEQEQEQDTPDKVSDYEKARDAYDESYRDIVNTVESVYNNDIVSKQNKDKFVKELEKNNYTIKNGKIVSLVPKEQQRASKAKAAEIAYREAKLDIYDDNADKIITEASTTREVLMKPLMEAENTYKDKLNTRELAEFVSLPYDYKRDYDNRLHLFEKKKDFTEYNNKLKEFDSFLLKNNLISSPQNLQIGVVNNISQRLEKDLNLKNKYLDFISDFNRLGVKYNPSDIDTAVKNRDEIISKYNVSNLLPSKYKNVINITQEEDRNRLIQLLPQTTRNEDGEVVATGVGEFNAKKPVTIKKIPDGYVIEQDRGISDSGEDKGKPLQPATTTVYRNSAAYNYIDQNVSSTSGNTISTQSVPKDFKITPVVKPTFISLEDENEDTLSLYENKLINNVNSRVLSDIANTITPSNIPDKVNPAIFLTKKGTSSYFKALLSDKVSPEQIDNMVDRVNKNFEKYAIKVKPNSNKQNWVLEFASPFADSPYTKLLGNSTELNKDYGYMVKTFPQVLILSEIAKILMKDPKKIDKI